MQGKLHQHVCVVTGVSGGIGRSIAARLLQDGAKVIGVDLVPCDMEGVEMEICNLGEIHAIESLMARVHEKYKKIDCLVNNGALGGGRVPFHEKSLEEYDSINNVNIRAPFLLSQAAIKGHLQASTSSDRPLVILNITSIAGTKPVALGCLYSMSKAALLSQTRSIAREYGNKNVRCVSVSPGYMEIPNVKGFSEEDKLANLGATALKRGSQPKEISDAIAWLASSEASYVTGTEFSIDGGLFA